MAKYPLPKEFMLPAELAKRLGMGILQVRSILHQDTERDVKVFPFAFSLKNEETGTWQYRIHRQRFEAWERGAFIERCHCGETKNVV